MYVFEYEFLGHLWEPENQIWFCNKYRILSIYVVSVFFFLYLNLQRRKLCKFDVNNIRKLYWDLQASHPSRFKNAVIILLSFWAAIKCKTIDWHKKKRIHHLKNVDGCYERNGTMVLLQRKKMSFFFLFGKVFLFIPHIPELVPLLRIGSAGVTSVGRFLTMCEWPFEITELFMRKLIFDKSARNTC